MYMHAHKRQNMRIAWPQEDRKKTCRTDKHFKVKQFLTLREIYHLYSNYSTRESAHSHTHLHTHSYTPTSKMVRNKKGQKREKRGTQGKAEMGK